LVVMQKYRGESELKQRFVVDTTALTDVEIRKLEGYESLCSSMSQILDLIAEARLKLEISCYVPYPTVYTEIMDFVKRYECGNEVAVKIDTWLVKKTPNRYEVTVPAAIFFDYIDYMREKINKGRRVAEEAMWEVSVVTQKLKGKNKLEIQEDVGKIIGKFREKYRASLRHGILDSAPDIDVLLLAKELEAGVVSSDLGIKKWAEKMGLRYVEASKFPRMIKEYLKKLGE